MTEQPGRSAIEYLLQSGKLEQLDPAGAESSALALLQRAELRLVTAGAALDHGDSGGAFAAAYDAYRMAADALLVRQAMRATGGAGSHAVVEDAVSAQFSNRAPQFAKATFERIRRTRHAAQYFDPDAPDITDADVKWAIGLARQALDSVAAILDSGELGRFGA